MRLNGFSVRRLRSSRSLLSACVVAAGLSASGVADAAYELEFVSGHGDIGIGFEDGELEPHYHLGEDDPANVNGPSGSIVVGDQEFEPDEMYVRVATSSFDTSKNAYVLPPFGNLAASQGVPFLGIASEELFVDGVAEQPFSNVLVSLDSFSGPGSFNFNQGGTPFFAGESDGSVSGSGFSIAVGAHDHGFWEFAELGVYDLGIVVSADYDDPATSIDDTVMLTNNATFRFVVGDLTAVPEPGSMAVLAIGGLALATRRRRRR